MNVSKYFTEDVIKTIKDEILKAEGNEVFFTGTINSDCIVYSLKTGARGNINTVPVNIFHSREKNASVLIHNHPGGCLQPSEADLLVASDGAENGQGFYIINNDVTDVYVVVEPVPPKVIVNIDEEEAGNYIAEGGALSKMSDNFEERTVQIELLKKIVKAFNENKIAIFEAGTGVGKSYSYLIPSVLWALKNDERVIISTGTINLQHQLCEKDIPTVEKIIGHDIKYILMKGRQNYVCRRRLMEAVSVLDLFEDDTFELNKIAEWAVTSPTGSRSDLTFMPSENVWTRVNSESDACMGMRCPFHSECFVMKIRKDAACSNLIIVNHHLLFADIESRMNGAGYDDAAVLPPYKRIVFDEAHGIENAATSFFSESVNRFKLVKLINQMYRKRRNASAGHLCSLSILSTNEDNMDDAYELTTNIKNSLTNIEISAKDLLINDSTLRLYIKTSRDFGPLLVSLSELIKYLSLFTDLIRSVMEGVEDDDRDVPCFWESKIVLRRLEAYILLLKDFSLWDENTNSVFWIQRRRLPQDMVKAADDVDYININKTPLDISHLMNEGIFENMDSVVCTSATLKTGRDFNYWMNRAGVNLVDKERVLKGVFDSPFPYEKNMLFAVPKDAPLPDSSEYQQYVEMAVPKLIKASEGRTLVLFTSYESLKATYRAALTALRGFPGRIMRQGEDDNRKLLEAFKKENESVLFATDSFWQGVDVPGESLSQVIIVKLPFTVPNEPVFVARSEAITLRGGNSFMELSVPEAIIKFRQGIGRLIRRSDDKGAVVVLDRRIYEKRYGVNFLTSMPPCKKMYEPISNILKKINRFIFD